MFTQFKSYIKQTGAPICIAAGSGALAGMASGVTVLSATTFNDPILGPCNSDDINMTLRAQMIGGITGLAVGAVIGSVFPVIQMFFDWCGNGRERSFREFQEINNSLQNVEIAISRP